MPGRVALVFDDAYMAYRHADWHPLQPRRVKLAVELIRSTGLAGFAEALSPRQATDTEVGLVHSQEYIELANPNNYEVDISGWKLAGAIDYTFRGGVVAGASRTRTRCRSDGSH